MPRAGLLLLPCATKAHGREYCEQALALNRENGVLGDFNTSAFHHLGAVHFEAGDFSQAIACYEQAARLALGLTGGDWDRANILADLGQAHLAAGDAPAARRTWEEALRLYDDSRIPAVSPVRAKLQAAVELALKQHRRTAAPPNALARFMRGFHWLLCYRLFGWLVATLRRWAHRAGGRAAAGPGRCRRVDGDPGAWVGQPAVLVRLLGPVEFLAADGSFAAVSQSRQRILLAMLAVVSGRTVAAEALVDALWAEEFSRDREKNLHSQVSALRRRLDGAVAGGGSRLVRVPGGYRLALSAQELDVGLFRALAGRGREAARAGDAAGARAAFGEALDLWRGPALADVTGLCSRLAGEGVVLDEQRAAVLEERLECDLALGRHGEIAGELTGLVREFPLRERMAGQLMVALYRCGRRGEALAVFDQTRRALAAELGLDPGPELAQTQRRVLADDPALAAPREGAGTGRIEDEPKGLGAGPALGSLLGAGRQPGSASSLVPRQLPAGAGFFAGRRAELKALDELLDSAGPGDGPGAVVVTAVGGLAGVGKTALAVHWARKVADRFPDGQLYVNLHGFGPRESPVLPEEAMSWFLSALGVPAGQIPADGQARAGLYRTVLAGRRVLTVIDNARDAAQVRPLLAGGPGCLAVVTSRSAMAGLAAADGARLIQLGPLKTDDSVRLLAVRLGPDLVAAEADAVSGLAKLCGGLPLALAIVTARAAARPGVPLAALVAELERAAAAEAARVTDPDAGRDSTFPVPDHAGAVSAGGWSCWRPGTRRPTCGPCFPGRCAT